MSKAHPEIKTIAVSHPHDGAIPFVKPRIMEAAKENGMTVVGDVIGIALDMIDFTPIAKKLMARNTDAICICNGWAPIFGGILKVARQSGYTKPIWETPPANCQDHPGSCRQRKHNELLYANFSSGDPKNPPIAVEMQRRLKAKYGHELIYSGAAGFDAIWFITQAIEAAQSLDPTVARDKWETMKTMKSVYGTARLGGLKTYGINHTMSHAQAVATFVDGVPKVMKWMDVATP